jgi:hypothetical protein
VPRGRAKFKADPGGGGNSPEHELWTTDPEQALREIARRNNATYIEGSLVFGLGGREAEALFETVEPEEDSAATKLFRLGEELDAFELNLFVGPDRWKRRDC